MSPNDDKIKRILEGALMAAGDPLTLDNLAKLFDQTERPSNKELRNVLKTLTDDYTGRGIELKQVASGYRFQVCADLGEWIGRLWEERPPRYSRALLETLSLIAYKQPITRGEIEDVRGVAVSTQIMRTLLEREWVRGVGHKDVPGKPTLYATTNKFLDYFNLNSLTELPALSKLRNIDELEVQLELAVQEPSEDS